MQPSDTFKKGRKERGGGEGEKTEIRQETRFVLISLGVN